MPHLARQSAKASPPCLISVIPLQFTHKPSHQLQQNPKLKPLPTNLNLSSPTYPNLKTTFFIGTL